MTGFKTFANNEVLTAADVNGYLMRQGVIIRDNVTQRNAIPTPHQGMIVYRKDAGILEMYHDVYHVTTNPTGAKTAGWYPIAKGDVYARGAWKTAIGINNTTLKAGFGAAGALFDAPTGNVPLPLTSTTYANEFFEITQAGDIKVKKEGRYDLLAMVQWMNVGAVIQTYIMKNETTIVNNTNQLAGMDFAAGASATTLLIAQARDVPLLTTDTVRIFNRNNTASAQQIGYAATPAAALFEIEWKGIIHA